jgi:hypothetical protein
MLTSSIDTDSKLIFKFNKTEKSVDLVHDKKQESNLFLF